MKVVDLTHVITQGMPVYPGTQGPKLMTANSYETDGFKETLISLYSHTGTHIDAPAHLFSDKTSLDQFPVTRFIGKALAIDCSALKEGQKITMAAIAHKRSQADSADFLLFHTGWAQYWNTERYFGDYPCIDEAVAEYLINTNKKGVGLDTIGIDPIADTALALHRKLLGHDFIIIENLTNLHLIGDELFTLFALPLHYANADGAPARAIAWIEV